MVITTTPVTTLAPAPPVRGSEAGPGYDGALAAVPGCAIPGSRDADDEGDALADDEHEHDERAERSRYEPADDHADGHVGAGQALVVWAAVTAAPKRRAPSSSVCSS